MDTENAPENIVCSILLITSHESEIRARSIVHNIWSRKDRSLS